MTVIDRQPDAAAPVSGRASVGTIELAYEAFGSPADPLMLMVMGLGTQMIAWPDEMCRELAADGRYVVRFDNRDIGLSTHLSHLGVPSLLDMLLRKAPYTVSDMAADAAGLIEHLGHESADVVGASMGGFISQTLAIEHPGRVRSLSLLMSSTGSRLVGQPKLKLIKLLARDRTASGPEEAARMAIEIYNLIGSPGFEQDNAYLRELAKISIERSGDPTGGARQLAACAAQPNRTAQLRKLDVPTVVMHGFADPLVRPSGGVALAKAIPGARFYGIPGWGHDLPRAIWPEVIARITENLAR